jgi:hypothetical protein
MKRSFDEFQDDSAAPVANNAPRDGFAASAAPAWTFLSMDLLVECMLYCNALDLLSVRQTTQVFRQAARLAVARSQSLHLSVLHIFNNKKRKHHQDALVQCLLQDVGACLQKMEMVGLKSIRGRLPLQHCPNLTSLSLQECTSLNPRLLESALRACPSTSLTRIDFVNCRRVDARVIDTIVAKWPDLVFLHIGGCSQTIADETFWNLSKRLRRLRALDMSGLRRLGKSVNTPILTLSSSLECLYLAGCEQLQFPVLERISHQLAPAFARRLEEGTLLALAQQVKEGNGMHVWNTLELELDLDSRQILHANRRADMDTILNLGWKNLRTLDLCLCGSSGRGIPRGLVGFLGIFSGGSLRVVNISGCDKVTDADIQVLATTCANSLTSFNGFGCKYGDEAIKALASNCENLAYLDVSSCYDVTDVGIMSLCPTDGTYSTYEDDTQLQLERRQGCPRLRTLKISNLPLVTGQAIFAIGGMHYDYDTAIQYHSCGGLKNLLVLIANSCGNVMSPAVEASMRKLPLLVELDARDLEGTISLSSAPPTLRFLNGRRLNCSGHRRGLQSRGCCNAMVDSQRLDPKKGVSPLPMYHCIDCKLLPSDELAICASCVKACHQGHRTFFNAVTRFYCDCSFGITAEQECKAVTSPTVEQRYD